MNALRPMRPRDTTEPHRVATPLELFFDLCFVVAVSFAGSQLHHALSEAHVGLGLTGYLTCFFAIWWAWMNYTWFASAYDVDDWWYRVTTLVQMSGVLVLAAGVPRAFTERDITLFLVGYVIMRLAMASQWLRAAAGHPEGRRTALRYAAGIGAAQVAWAILLLFVPREWLLAGFVVCALIELAVPVWAESAGRTPWHAHHIAERYGLFTLIMMGENILAATIAVQEAGSERGIEPGLILLSVSALVIVFALWWIYFAPPAAELLTSNRQAIPWGYGHFLIFAAVGAVSSGVEVAVDQLTGKAHLSAAGVGYTIAVPVAVFLFMVWLLHIRPHRYGPADTAAVLCATLLVLLAPLTPAPAPVIAGVTAALVVITEVTRKSDPRRYGRRPRP
ncbi:low temperature requirement protein A [Nonomuraea typhae]|uniref:low temperature requirement protein A n=1 Tax=Nonomuraea typhae TaxID=2603600 RepID=UPI001C68055A|nr:low temperature requirement protein A [Nonomuraea typhae]